jgi:hypothetical protein
MDQTLHLPVRSYVYKYCQKVFSKPGATFTGWRLDTNLKEGKMLYAMLERAPDRYEKHKTSLHYLNVTIPTRIIGLKGCYLSPESVELFNDYVKQLILEEILSFETGIRSRIGLKAIDKVTINQYQQDRSVRVLRIKPREASKFFWQKAIISDVLAKYDITEDEISSESITKTIQRSVNYRYSA